MTPAPRILFVAGDPSGDQQAAAVARELKRQNPEVQVLALGGPSLREVADRFLADLTKESVMGFWEPLKRLPVFWRIFRRTLLPALDEFTPDLVVPVDFFGFNQHLVAAAAERGLRTWYFIGPQVWASRENRVRKLRGKVEKMLVLFPFEKDFYQARSVEAEFFGHPLLDRLPEPAPMPECSAAPMIGLLPGSRAGEVVRHLPIFLAAFERLRQCSPELRGVLFLSPVLDDAFYAPFLKAAGAWTADLKLVRDENYRWRREINLALTVSGTATLENALLGIPMVACFQTSWLTYRLAKALLKIPYVAIPNILAGEELVKELIQDQLTPEQLVREAGQLLESQTLARAQRERLLQLRDSLGPPGAVERIAAEMSAALA